MNVPGPWSPDVSANVGTRRDRVCLRKGWFLNVGQPGVGEGTEVPAVKMSSDNVAMSVAGRRMTEVGARGSESRQARASDSGLRSCGRAAAREQWAPVTEILQLTPKGPLHSGCFWENSLPGTCNAGLRRAEPWHGLVRMCIIIWPTSMQMPICWCVHAL